MTGNHSNSSEMGKSSPTQNNTTVINNDPSDGVEIIMESSIEENPAKDLKSISQGQNKGKTKEFEASYNDAEKMTNNDYDRRIKHESEIVFSKHRYTTPVSFEFSPDENHNI